MELQAEALLAALGLLFANALVHALVSEVLRDGSSMVQVPLQDAHADVLVPVDADVVVVLGQEVDELELLRAQVGFALSDVLGSFLEVLELESLDCSFDGGAGVWEGGIAGDVELGVVGLLGSIGIGVE